jgi:hypothetical protein
VAVQVVASRVVFSCIELVSLLTATLDLRDARITNILFSVKAS